MIQALIEEYRATNDRNALRRIRAVAASGDSGDALKAAAFLCAEGEEEHKELLLKAGRQISQLPVDEDGLFYKEGVSQEEFLADILPVYALYKTKTDKNYNELTAQCRQAAKKYPDSEAVFAMLAEVLEYMSEQIFEHYQTVRKLLWEQYTAVAGNASDRVCYGLAKGCFYRAFLLERYEKVLTKALKDKESYQTAYFAVLRLEKLFDRN